MIELDGFANNEDRKGSKKSLTILKIINPYSFHNNYGYSKNYIYIKFDDIVMILKILKITNRLDLIEKDRSKFQNSKNHKFIS